MDIRIGCELVYDCPQYTPMMLMLSVHETRQADMIVPYLLTTDPPVSFTGYRDLFGNWCTRLVAPPGRIRIGTAGVVRDSGLPDPVVPDAPQHMVQDLPDDTLE